MDSSKRSFLKLAFVGINGALGVLMGVPVLGYVLGPLFRKTESKWVEAGGVDEFKSGEPKARRLRYVSGSGYREVEKDRNVWVMNEGTGLTVFSSECPHVGCNVVWHGEEQGGVFICPCHGGHFNRNGDVLSGPPPRPLKRLATKVENGKVFIEV